MSKNSITYVLKEWYRMNLYDILTHMKRQRKKLRYLTREPTRQSCHHITLGQKLDHRNSKLSSLLEFVTFSHDDRERYFTCEHKKGFVLITRKHNFQFATDIYA